MKRTLSFIERARSLAVLGGWIAAIKTVIRIKLDPVSINSVVYQKKPVFFRRQDEQVIREVLVYEEYSFLKDYIQSATAPKVLDVGAHIGTFALWTQSLVEDAHVVSVEADPMTFKMLEANVIPRRQAGAKWEAIQRAAGSRDGDRFRFSDLGPSMSHRIDAKGTLSVETISLKSLITKFSPSNDRVNIVKVDIEGAEEDFLCSSPKELERINVLAVELHPYLLNPATLSNVLSNSFNSVEIIGNRTSAKPILLCKRV